MSKFRCIIAFMLAIFIASPACCCLGAIPTPAKAEHSCCGGKEENQKEQHKACACTTAKHQKLADADSHVPPAMEVPAPGVIFLIHRLAPPSDEDATAAVEPGDFGPPRLRLAVWQRFLI